MSNLEEPMRFAIIGSGGIARAHVAAARALEIPIVGLCDVSAHASRALAETFGLDCPRVGELAQLFEAARPEAVLICTPPATHLVVALKAFEHGAHVLCEKPLAINADEAGLMLAASRVAKRHLMMSAKFRFVPAVQQAREFLRNEEIGRPYLLRIAFCSPIDMRRRWNGDPALSGGGVLMDNGPHALDLARFLLGELQFESVEFNLSAGYQVESEAKIQLRTAEDVKVQIELSWDKASQEAFIAIAGEKGNLEVGWEASRLDTAFREVTFGGYDKAAAFRNQLRYFAQAARGEAAEQASREDGVAVARLIEAAYGAGRSLLS